MARDPAIGRYRRWYGRLLHLYPRAFRERFGEPMAQTFADLLGERTHARRGLHAFALRAFADTAAGILRENMTQLTQTRAVLRWVAITAALLAIPLLAMLLDLGLPDPGSGATDGVNWGPIDFAIMGILVLGSGLLYEYASARGGTVSHRAAVAIAVAAGFLLIWANLAVGMIGDEGNPANLMYVFVLFVALAGAAIARFESGEASIAMFATAAAHVAVAVIALAGGMDPELRADAFFVAAWVTSGLLFRQASMAPSAAG